MPSFLENTIYSIQRNFIILVHILQDASFNVKRMQQEETVRRVERGAKLLAALHSDTACILQMPRGNLELVHPRTLLVAKLKSDIDK